MIENIIILKDSMSIIIEIDSNLVWGKKEKKKKSSQNFENKSNNVIGKTKII